VIYKKGSVPLATFMTMPYEKEIIEKIVIVKDGRKASYQMFRNSRADFPILNLAVSKDTEGRFIVTVGARGQKAVRADQTAAYLTSALSEENGDMEKVIKQAGELLTEEVSFTDNMRASAEYRKILSKVLLKKAVMEVQAC
jgi:CO/xanthine dehydrogenase FAD-binding subunit